MARLHMKRLYYARHGEAENNLTGIWQSRSSAPLTELGRQQALAEGRKAREQGLQFDVIISSPITRARQTAEIIAQEVGYPIDKIIYSELFVERYYGELENTSVKETFEKMSYQEIDNVPGAETIEAMHQRAKAAYQFLLDRPEHSILVVSHSAFGRALRRVVLARPHTDEYVTRTSLPHAEIICWLEPDAD